MKGIAEIGGKGLRIMADRAKMIGGRFAVQAHRPAGVELSCLIPQMRSGGALMTRKLKVPWSTIIRWCGMADQPDDQQPDMEVCGEADGIPDAVKILKATSPDVAVVDLSLKDASGPELVKTIKSRWPGVGVVVRPAWARDVHAERCIRAGARG
jgi:CheY-like chemotaxis protein